MSFKKKAVVISGSSSGRPPNPLSPGSGETPISSNPGGTSVAHTLQSSRQGPISGTPSMVVTPTSNIGSIRGEQQSGRGRASPISTSQSIPSVLDHEGVKPSIQASAPSISTGSGSLDKLLGHGGLPLGSVLIVEESGTTDFSSILLRSYAAQGIIHARLKQDGSRQQRPLNGATKVVIVGADESWGYELPGIFKDKKEAARERLRQEESKISVGNLANESITTTASTSSTASSGSSAAMKIAWRYAGNSGNNDVSDSSGTTTTKPNYSTQFDFTSRLMPRPNNKEVTYIPIKVSSSFAEIISQLEIIFEQASKSAIIIRLVIPSLLHPAIYSPKLAQPTELVPFLHSLQGLCRTYSNTVTAVISLPLQLYPRETALIRWVELLSDGVIHLEAFPEETVNDLKEAASSSVPSSSKINQSQGLVHIYKLPVLSERGVMVVRRSEHAFRVGRRQFEIYEWGIPIDDAPPPPPPSSSTKENQPSISTLDY